MTDPLLDHRVPLGARRDAHRSFAKKANAEDVPEKRVRHSSSFELAAVEALDPNHRVDPAPSASSVNRSTLAILWIDRNPHDLELATLVLNRLAPQFHLVAVSELNELVNACAQHDFALAVLGDTEEPARAESVRQALRVALPDIPLLLFAETGVDVGLRLLRNGFDDFMPKSSRSFLELPEFLSKALGRAQERDQRTDRETRLSRLLDYVGVGTFRATIDGRLLDANAAFLAIFDLENLELARQTDFGGLLRPSPDQTETAISEPAPLREIKHVQVDDDQKVLQVTRVVLLTPDGELAVDGLIENAPTLSPEQVQLASTPVIDSAATPRAPEGELHLATEEPQTGHLDGANLNLPMSRGPLADANNLPLPQSSLTLRTKAMVSLDQVFKHVLSELAAPLEHTHAVVKVAPLPEVYGNSAQLEILFRNLVENAIRFRSEQPPQIQVSARKNAHKVTISVHDNGVGMTAAARHRVLGFEGTIGPDTPVGHWSPLGLAISRRIVEHHQGQLWAESDPQRGSVFHVELPRRSSIPDARPNTFPTDTAGPT